MEMPDTNRGKWEEARELLATSAADLRRFSHEGDFDEHRGALEQAVTLEAAIKILDSGYLLGNY
jgi:hypothetical protein